MKCDSNHFMTSDSTYNEHEEEQSINTWKNKEIKEKPKTMFYKNNSKHKCFRKKYFLKRRVVFTGSHTQVKQNAETNIIKLNFTLSQISHK